MCVELSYDGVLVSHLRNIAITTVARRQLSVSSSKSLEKCVTCARVIEKRNFPAENRPVISTLPKSQDHLGFSRARTGSPISTSGSSSGPPSFVSADITSGSSAKTITISSCPSPVQGSPRIVTQSIDLVSEQSTSSKDEEEPEGEKRKTPRVLWHTDTP